MNLTKRKEPSACGRLLFAARGGENGRKDEKSALANEQRLRAKATLKRYAVLLTLGIAYLIFCRTTGLSLPCPFHAVTGLDCPGCGITRLALALSEGDFAAAFHANEALFVLGPILLLFLLRNELHWILRGEAKDVPRPFIGFLLLAFALFTIWRNFLR